MTDRHSQRVTAVTATGPTEKRVPRVTVNPWRTPVTYELADGTTQAGAVTTSRKKDGPTSVADLDARAKRGAVEANYHGDEFVGTTTSYWIGPAADNPYADA